MSIAFSPQFFVMKARNCPDITLVNALTQDTDATARGFNHNNGKAQFVRLICLNKGTDRSEEEIAKECVAMVRRDIGPVAAFKRCIVIDALPKTRSGKVLRGTMVAIADSKPWNLPATIDDPATLDAIAARISGIGETVS